MHIFDIIALLIFLSGLFLFINTIFLKLPSSIGLTVLALLLSLVVLIIGTYFPSLHLAEHVKEYDFQEVLYQFVLSVMLFAGAINIDLKALKDQKVPVFVLATVGVFISTIIIGSLVFFMLDAMSIEITYMYCLVFGALISSTDPIAITKTIKRFNVPKDIQTKISGEAFFNDGIAVVLALTLLQLASAQDAGSLTFGSGTIIFLRDIGGGIITGIVFGYLGYKLLGVIDNEEVQVEVLVTVALVMVGSLVADLMFVNSKMVAFVMGLIIRNMSAPGEESGVGTYVFKFWNLMEESLAAMLFVLIGLEMLVIPWRLDYFAAGFFAVNIVLFGRWVSVFIPIKLMSVRLKFDKSTVSVLTWGGLRGGLPVAQSLALPIFIGEEVILTMTYVVVVSSVLYQGLSLPTLLRASYQETVEPVED